MGKIFSYDDFHMKALREMAKELGIPRWSKLLKPELVEKLGAADPTGKCARSKQDAAPAVKSSAEEPKGADEKTRAVSSLKKDPAAKKSSAKSAASAAKPTPAEEPAASKPAKSAKSAEPGSAKREKAPAKEKAAAKKDISAKTEIPPAKPEAAPKPAARPKSLAARVNVVRSRLRMSPSEPIVFSSSENAEKKTKGRRLPPPRREDVTKIPMSDTEEDTLRDEPIKDPNRPEPPKERIATRKTLETPSSRVSGQDRIVLQVCGPFWLHAWWEISANIITRIRAAMGFLWHTADPILRLYRVRFDSERGRTTEFVQDFLIHGGIYNWFLNVDDPPGTFFVEIGYLTRDKQFFSLVSSNTVETPQNYIQESMGWSESGWNMLTASTTVSPFESGALDAETAPAPKPSASSSPRRRAGFDLQVDAEVVIKGRTSPDAQLTVRGERIWIRDDGTFLIRYHLPDRRHVFPVAAVSRDGIDSKTVVLSVERNTKNLETVVRQKDED